jgi:hypothetical protein
MKFSLVILLIATRFLGFSQESSDPVLKLIQPIDTVVTEIQLNPSLDTLKSSIWENGDYKIYIKTQAFIAYLQNEYSSLVRAMQQDFNKDSLTLVRYNVYATRYLKAINQIDTTENGFDLRQLILYIGPENSESNKGNSEIVELYLRMAIENGNASVFYRGKRIFKLKKLILNDYVMSTIKIYFDDDKNYVFSYFGHINW